jgi:hypothetical protein
MIVAVVLIVLAAVAVVVIALVAVGRVTGQLAAAPPQARFDMPEAVEFVASALPDEITAQLSYDQLEGLLRAHLDYLNSNDLTDGVRYASGTGLIVVADDETLGYLLDRVEAAEWWDVTPEMVTAVLEAELAYLESIGAIGTPVPDPSAIEDGSSESENDVAEGDEGA